MTIKLVKPKKLLPKDVDFKDVKFDENWMLKSIKYKETKPLSEKSSEDLYEITVMHIPTKLVSNPKIIRLMEVPYDKGSSQISVYEGDNHFYYSRHTLTGIKRTRNIILALEYALRDVQIVKGLFDIGYSTKRETEKKFGKIFNTNGYARPTY